MARKRVSARSLCWIAVALALSAGGLWTVRVNSAAAHAHRVAWETRAAQLKVPVYPHRPHRLGFWKLILPASLLPNRPETIVQTLSEMEVESLLSLELRNCPDGLVIMVGGISERSRNQLAEAYPEALIVDYPNMPL